MRIDTKKLFAPKAWGWRFVGFDLRMPNGQLVEWYLPLKELEMVKDANHLLFEKWRNETNETLAKHAGDYYRDVMMSRRNYDAAWYAALERMGYADEAAALASFSSVEARFLSETSSKDSIISSGVTTPSTPKRQGPPGDRRANKSGENTATSPVEGFSSTRGV